MRPKINLEWVNNLWEVGAPIRDEAREIQWRQEQARERLELAKREFEESILCCQLSANTLEARIKTLWSSDEIEAAKRGVILDELTNQERKQNEHLKIISKSVQAI